MNNRLRYIPLCLLALAMVTPTASQAQQYYAAANNQVVAPAPLPQAQLDALLAPIALYPDQLLAQVLMASTYPGDVADAGRFVQANPSLTGAALDQALQNQSWDPSVLSLAAYPQVLLMMNDMPDWTRQLGHAFLANQPQVMDTVQMLRARAQAQGYLRSSEQQTVLDQGGVIDIEPAQPQYVYVPVYDPTVIYGAWSDAYVPFYWYPPAIYGYPGLAPGFTTAIFFGAPCRIDYNHWGWARPNWRGHGIDVNVAHNYFANRPQYASLWRDGRWTHSPEPNRNVASRDIGFHGGAFGNAEARPREANRTRDSLPPQQAIARPAPQPPAVARPQQWQQSYARPQQPQQSYVRPAQPQQSYVHPAQLQQPIARTPPPPARPIARPAQPQVQSSWRVPEQSFARPTQPSRQFASPVMQRSAPQVAYSQQPHAQTQANARHGEVHRS